MGDPRETLFGQETGAVGLVEGDLEKILGYEGVVERYGMDDQLEVVSPKVRVFFECLDTITTLGPYVKSVEKARAEGVQNPEGEVLKTMVQELGRRTAHPDVGATKNSLIVNGIGKDADSTSAAKIFAGNLANLVDGERWSFYQREDLPKYHQIVERAAVIVGQRKTELHELGTKTITHIPDAFIRSDAQVETPEDARLLVEELGDDLKGYTQTLEDDLRGSTSQFRRAKNTQPLLTEFINKRLEAVENQAEVLPTLPEVIILGGVGHEEKTWEERLKFYRGQGIQVRYIQCPDFTEGDSFEKQADWLYDQLGQVWGKEYSFEAHSRGGLALWHLMNKHPELANHAIITSSPTRSDDEFYPYPLVFGLKWGLANPEACKALIGNVKALEIFARMKDWKEAFRVYLGHIGESGNSQWDELIEGTSPPYQSFSITA